MVSTTEQTPASGGNSLSLVGRRTPAVQMNLRILNKRAQLAEVLVSYSNSQIHSSEVIDESECRDGTSCVAPVRWHSWPGGGAGHTQCHSQQNTDAHGLPAKRR